MDLSWTFFAVAGLFFAGIIKGASGIGYSSCALPFLVPVLGLQPAITLVVLPAMASNAAVVLNAGYFRETINRFWPLYLATLPGIFAGINLLTWVDKRIPAQVLGVLIVLYSLQAWFQPRLSLPAETAHKARVPVGFLNGFLTGLTGSQVMPLMPYMLALQMDTDRFVQAVNIAVIIASAFLAAGLWMAGLMSPPGLALSALAIIPALTGVQLGSWARQRIPAAKFRSLILILLFLIGISLAVRT